MIFRIYFWHSKIPTIFIKSRSEVMIVCISTGAPATTIFRGHEKRNVIRVLFLRPELASCSGLRSEFSLRRFLFKFLAFYICSHKVFLFFRQRERPLAGKEISGRVNPGQFLLSGLVACSDMRQRPVKMFLFLPFTGNKKNMLKLSF